LEGRYEQQKNSNAERREGWQHFEVSSVVSLALKVEVERIEGYGIMMNENHNISEGRQWGLYT